MVRTVVIALVVACAALAAAGCGGAASNRSAPSGAAPSGAAPSGAASSVAPLVIDVTIAAGQVTPSGKKIDASVGQQVILNVTSDRDDEVHAHTGGDGYELEVKAGTPATGTFTLTSPGSFEIESHHLEKTIVILNAR